MANYLLGDFLIEEIAARGISAREFARLMGVSHVSVSKFLDYGKKDVGYPSVDFILKLAKATGKDIREIMLLIDPTVPAESVELDEETREIAEEILTLPRKERRLVRKFVRSLMTEEG